MIKLKSYFFVIVLSFLLLVSVFGCSASDSEGNTSQINFIDITNAKALMVSPRTSNIGSRAVSPQISASSNVFVKILSDDSIEEVTIQDVDGNTIDGIIPSNIYNATNTFMIIIIDNNPFLVNKSDGSAYDLSPVGVPDMGTQSGYRSTKRFYSDSTGNIYYVSGGRIKKINISDPDNITAENYTTDLDTVYEFAVDLNGNAIYSRTGSYGLPLEPCRIRKANGGLYNTGSENKAFFTGLDGNLYCNYTLVNDGTSTVNAIYKINIDLSYNVSFTQYGNVGSTITDWGHILHFNDRILNVNCQEEQIHEVYTASGFPRASTACTFLNNGISVKQSNDYFYVLKSSGSIVKVNPVNYTYTTLVNDGDYEMYMLEVSNDNTVLFNALRMSDGKKVVGKISSSGSLTIIDDTMTENVIILQRVN